MNAMRPPAIGPNKTAKNAPRPYAVWMDVSGIPVGTFTYINSNANSAADLCEKMAEYTLAVVKDRPNFHINIVNQVSPYCDCYSCNDVPIIPDVGMFASFDPVALDQACADACNNAPAMKDSFLDAQMRAGCDRHDHFTNVFPDTDWRVTLRHAEEIGVGTTQYELVTV